MILLAHFVFKRSGQSEGVEKWEDAKRAEGAVDQSPANGYLANGSANERQRNHEHTSNDAGLQNPNVAHGVNKYADEENSNDKLCDMTSCAKANQSAP